MPLPVSRVAPARQFAKVMDYCEQVVADEWMLWYNDSKSVLGAVLYGELLQTVREII